MQLYIPKRNRVFGPSDALGLIGIAGLAVAHWVPLAKLLPFWGCSFRKFTGVPCPGCGLTRVADRVSHLNILGALKANPLGTVAAVGFLLLGIATVLHLAFGMPVPELVLDEREWRRVRWLAVLAFVINYAFVVYAYRVLHFT